MKHKMEIEEFHWLNYNQIGKRYHQETGLWKSFF